MRHKETKLQPVSLVLNLYGDIMDKETLTGKARAIDSPKDLLDLLNEIKSDLLGSKAYPFSLKQFRFLCNPKIGSHRYHSFEIPKKSGGYRQICAPCGSLKWLQLCLNEIFKALYTPSPYAMGFAVGRSIVDNARMHTNQNYVFNIDLEDFFPSIDQARVWKRLQLAPFNFNAKVASVIAGLCSIRSIRYAEDGTFAECFVLPQGAPTSPLLTNAICDTLDRRLHGLAKRFGLHYSRYADDITFSSMHNVYHPDSEFRRELSRIITGQRFTINEAKTRLNHCSKRQEVTGLTVGSKINVSRKYVKDLRAILHIWEKYGMNAAYAVFYPRYKSEKCQIRRGEPNLENVISGKLCYLKMVKGETDPVYVKLNSQFRRLTDGPKTPVQQPNIDYLLTMSKADFEQKLGVSIKFDTRKDDGKPYGCFYYQDRYFKVAVSKNLNVNKLPSDVQISLTRMVSRVEARNSTDRQLQSPQPTMIRIGYMLHKPLRNYRPQIDSNTAEDNSVTKLRGLASRIAALFPKLELSEDMELGESNNQTNLLDRLVDTNFDLSILP